MKSQRSKIFLAILPLLAVGFLVTYLSRPKEPTYANKTLTEWLKVYDGTYAVRVGNRMPADETSINAVKQIGTNAIPFLLEKLTSHETGFEKYLRSKIIKLPMSFLHSPFPEAAILSLSV